MSARARTSALAIFTVLAASACAPAQKSRAAAGVSDLPGSNNAAGYVLSGRSLQEHGGTLLAYLYGRVSGMQVDYSAFPCPAVQIRGRKSMFGSSDPVVYVDGARAANSCVLESLLTRDLSRVEVYPMGVTNKPGYEAHPNGLILVFLISGPMGDLETPQSEIVASTEALR